MNADGVTIAAGELTLDPFAYVPDMASQIEGLGGYDRPAEGGYALHTHYVEVAEGPAQFTLLFEGLDATRGTLNLRVHMLTAGSPHATLATAERIALNRLVHLGGSIPVRFEAFQGATYALYGGVVGDTDARALTARVVLDRPADPNARREVAAEARDTEFGRAARPAAYLISLRRASLRVPVSQFATAAQLREREAAPALAATKGRSRVDQWRAAYLHQALRVYGMAETGARGLALGEAAARFAPFIASQGPSIEVAVPAEAADEARSWLAGAGGGDVNVRVGHANPPSSDLVNFDFVWTDGWPDDGGGSDGVRWIDAAMACLRPGGLAVHLVAYDPGDEDGVRALSRNHIERALLVLVSRGHEAAELRIDSTGLLYDDAGLSVCGIVARKASLRSGA